MSKSILSLCRHTHLLRQAFNLCSILTSPACKQTPEPHATRQHRTASSFRQIRRLTCTFFLRLNHIISVFDNIRAFNSPCIAYHKSSSSSHHGAFLSYPIIFHVHLRLFISIPDSNSPTFRPARSMLNPPFSASPLHSNICFICPLVHTFSSVVLSILFHFLIFILPSGPRCRSHRHRHFS